MKPTASELYAQLYDTTVHDWNGELDFYKGLVREMKAESVLEIACGTGRVATRLGQAGMRVVGMDLSTEMLDIARKKSAHLKNIQWVQADMKSFDLAEKFDLIISPGHSFQFMLTPEDQLTCLKSIQRHLNPHGMLAIHIDHQDLAWLGNLPEKEFVFEKSGETTYPENGNRIQISRAWRYEASTQTAQANTLWEELGKDGTIINKWEMGPVRLHCIFSFEMEHLLLRAGFRVKAIYGDFFEGVLGRTSSEMIWVAVHEN